MPKKNPKVLGGGNTNSPSKRQRLYCFTYFPESGDDSTPPVLDKTMQYIEYGAEKCPTTGNFHWQSWCYFKNTKDEIDARRLIHKSCHGVKCNVTRCEGTIGDQIAYCRKEALWHSQGEEPQQQGKRTDLESIAEDIANGASVDSIALERPIIYHQYGRTLSKLEDLRMRKEFRTTMTTCDWLWGKTGVGKSHAAFENYHPDTHYLWRDDNGWWEGYTQQHTLIVNDFRGELSYNQLLQIVDKWPFMVKRRNREPMPFMSKHVIITSSLPPEKIYNRRLDEDAIEQLLRRIRVIKLEERTEPKQLAIEDIPMLDILD